MGVVPSTVQIMNFIIKCERMNFEQWTFKLWNIILVSLFTSVRTAILCLTSYSKSEDKEHGIKRHRLDIDFYLENGEELQMELNVV